MAIMKVNFSASAQAELVPAFEAYIRDYRTEAKASGTPLVVNASASLTEKGKIVDFLAKREITRLAGLPSGEQLTDAEAVQHPGYRWAFNAVVTRLISGVLPGVIREDLGGLAEVSVSGRDNSVTFVTKSSHLYTVKSVGRSRRHVDAEKDFMGDLTLTPTMHEVTTTADLAKLRAGEESLAEYTAKIVLSIKNGIAVDCAALLNTVYTNSIAALKETGFTPTAFKNLATRVGALNGSKAVAYGTELALMNVLPTNEYLKVQLGAEFNRIGYLPVFLNTPLVALSQAIDWSSANYDFALPDDIILFIAQGMDKPFKIVLEDEGLLIQDPDFQNASLTVETSVQQGYAVGLVTGAHIGVMKLQ